MSLTPGTRLGSYEINAHIGAGGMGDVYRATDNRLGREVAVKVLPANLATDPNRLARLEQEARTVASLNHPNIVTLFSIEEADGIRFLTMELVTGDSLAKQVVPGGLPVERVLELGVALTEALAAAHEKGVVHRDLKPQNVMMTRSGMLKVLDFGLAKMAEPDSHADAVTEETVATPLSTPGQVVGTLPYMAPEQVRGEQADSRTDLFALGVLLYELATGRRPFEGATTGVISSAILRDAPTSPTRLRADFPPDLDRIISRCLEKDPAARYQSAGELSRDLQSVGQGRVAAAPSEALRVAPPVPSTPLLGREADLDAAVEKLEQGARVLTISGYGGTGKTRFSIELFRRLSTDYEGGAAFVSLASVTDAAEVLSTVAVALEIAEAHGRSALEALCTVIGEQSVLLVMDNLEQVLGAAGEIATLVARCPGLRVVATSRAPLKIGAETEFVLPPLALPGKSESSLDVLRDCPSVALFVQRAAKVKPDFALTDANVEAVTAICRQLDGLPLALELAAARVRILDPSKLLQRLDHALDLLTSGDRDLPLRQRTLRATISWSYSLLDAPEQQLLRRCSVFHEGWTFEAMEQVCYGEDDRWRALDELESLVEKGLVRVIGSGERYSLLETIRAFSAEQLHAGGEVERIRDAHADHFVRFTAEMAAEFRGVGQVAAHHRIRGDNANELAAIHWLRAGARGGNVEALEKALLLCGQLNWFWHVHGLHNTAHDLLDELLPLAGDLPPSRGRGLAWLAASMVSSVTGELDRALDEARLGYEDGQALGDEALAAEGRLMMGYAGLGLGRMDEVASFLGEAIERSGGEVDVFVYALSMTIEGMLLFQSGDQEAGMRRVEEALEIQRRQKDREAGGVSLSLLASMHFGRGNLTRARELYTESLRDLEEIGDRPEIARVHCETGWTALADEDAPAAQHAFRLAVQVYEEVGSPRGTGLALLGLAAVEAAEGRSERAVSIAVAAQALADRAGVVCDHPMDPGVVERIEALKVSIPRRKVDGLVADASALTPAAVLAMLHDTGS